MTQQIRKDIAIATGHEWQDGRWWKDGKVLLSHPIPDTIDAAVGVIEGAGYQVYYVARDDEAMRVEAESASGIVRITHRYSSERGEHPLKAALFELALACVKAGKGGA